MRITFIIPSYNEEANVAPFFDAATEAFARQSDFDGFELLFIDDGSTDGTLAAIRELVPPAQVDVRAVSFSRNFGKEAGMYAGLQHATGDIQAIIDADLQQPPRVAFEMAHQLICHPEYDCVAAYQEQRKQGAVHNALARRFYKTLKSSSGMDVVADASDFRAFRRNVADALLQMPEYFRFSKGLFSWVGFRTLAWPYEVQERNAGSSSWSTRKLASYALDGILSFSVKPLRVATMAGLLLSLASIIYLIVVLVQTLAFGVDVPGYATIVCLILLMGGIQLLVLGIIGEYLGRAYIQGKMRPIYLVREEYEKRGSDES